MDIFYELRAQQFPLGIGEYALALRALATGFGLGSREELTFMCQTLWAKTLEEQAQVRKVLDALLPKRLTIAELRKLGEEAKDVVSNDEVRLTHIFERLALNRPPRIRVPSPIEGRRASETPVGRMFQFGRSALASLGTQAPAAGVAARPPAPPRQADVTFDFVGSLPITRRQMKQGWRHYRRMRREGVPSELDIQATVQQIHRFGVLVEPVLVPRRRNLARLLILCDVSRSMTPFHRVTHALLDSAQHSGLGGVSLLFFNNLPGPVLFRDPRLNSPLSVHEALKPFKRAGVLIISDGGAARGNFDAERARRTAVFLQTLRLYTRSVAWLNPTPESRWGGTSAGAICKQSAIQMATVDYAGFIETVDVLRGRGR